MPVKENEEVRNVEADKRVIKAYQEEGDRLQRGVTVKPETVIKREDSRKPKNLRFTLATAEDMSIEVNKIIRHFEGRTVSRTLVGRKKKVKDVQKLVQQQIK